MSILGSKETPDTSTLSTPCKSAIQILKSKFKIDKNPEIIINRNIPFSSGLGGESSNAAAILKALNKLWSLNLKNDELRKIAAETGMDVPFFIEGGLALGTNFGEEITQLEAIDLEIKINPKSLDSKNKTANAYQSLDLEKCGLNTKKTKLFLEGIKTKNLMLIKENLHNDFETITAVQKGEYLSGSGPSTFKLEV